MFQLTRPRGTRPAQSLDIWHLAQVSTHASAGDATNFRGASFIEITVSTHASAGDATFWRAYVWGFFGFNSRVRGGRDSRVTGVLLLSIVSTHASAGDATASQKHNDLSCEVSTHASAGDATNPSEGLLAAWAFQLTRPRGTRQFARRRAEFARRFNSRVRGGRDASAWNWS